MPFTEKKVVKQVKKIISNQNGTQNGRKKKIMPVFGNSHI